LIIQGNERSIQRGGIMGEQQYEIALSPKIYSMMSDKLYTDRIGSVVREVCSNAWDAQKMLSMASGLPMESFKVTLPTDLEPHFIVEDSGPGMPDEIAQRLYRTLGLSTKENSNDQIGAFGLGSKSPFAVTDTFTVENTHEGITHFYLCFKSEGGLPSLLKTGERDEGRPNGVKVIIPAPGNKYIEYKKALMRQLIVMEPKPIIANIETFDFIDAVKSAEMPEGFVLSNASDLGLGARTIYARMGMVLYPVDVTQIGLTAYGNSYSRYSTTSTQIHHNLDGKSTLILEFDIGDIEPLPSREGLTYDDKTKQRIKDKYDAFVKSYRVILRKEIEEQPTPLDAWRKLRAIHSSMQIDFSNDVYNLGYLLNNDYINNSFPTFEHTYQKKVANLSYFEMQAQGKSELAEDDYALEDAIAVQSQFEYVTFDRSDLRLTTKRIKQDMRVNFSFIDQIDQGTYKFLVMDEIDPKHRIGRMKSVLNNLARRDTCFVVTVNENYTGSKTDFSELITSFERIHPGITADNFTLFSTIPRPEREKRQKVANESLEGVTVRLSNSHMERKVKTHDLENWAAPEDVTPEDDEDEEWLAEVEKAKKEFIGRSFYVTLLRNDLIEYPKKSVQDILNLARDRSYNVFFVRKTGVAHLPKLKDFGIKEFKEFINDKLDGYTPNDDYRSYNSAKLVGADNLDWFSYSRKSQLIALVKKLKDDREYIHPFFDVFSNIVRLESYGQQVHNFDDQTRLINYLRNDGYLVYMENCEWSKNLDADISGPFKEQLDDVEKFYPALSHMLKLGMLGLEPNVMLYSYILDYNTLRGVPEVTEEEFEEEIEE
jgi:hypothetical protein